MKIEERLRELEIELPEPPAPAANYRPWVRTGSLVFISGQLPLRDGRVVWTGRLGAELGVDDGRQAARLCALNVLSQIRAALDSFDRLETVVRLDGHVACVEGFREHPKVLDGASELLKEVLGDAAGHSRVALGHVELPLGAAVEVAATVAARA